MGMAVDCANFGGLHFGGFFLEISEVGEGDFGHDEVFGSSPAGGVRGVEAAVDGVGGGALAVGEPLEGEGGPLEFLDEEAVVDEACVFDPGGVGVGVFLLHGANNELESSVIIRMKVTVSERRRERSQEEELVELSCRTQLSRINCSNTPHSQTTNPPRPSSTTSATSRPSPTHSSSEPSPPISPTTTTLW